jgi:Pvc16 N-terminal domain
VSNEMAVAAVTVTLQSLLGSEVKSKMVDPPTGVDLTKDLLVTSLPPHLVRTKHTSENVVNLFLYRTEVSAAWRNRPLPLQSRGGEGGSPPLALHLEYLVTAYGEDDREIAGHFLLAQAMRALHDRGILPRDRLQLAFESAHVHDQIEAVTLTPRSLSIDEMSKLWSTFQTQYRISAAYLITVLLIESRLPVRSPLPVLQRGKDDKGVTTSASPMPLLAGARPRSGFAALQLGEELIISGENFDKGPLTAMLFHPLFGDPKTLPVAIESGTRASIQIPKTGEAPEDWPAGYYQLVLVLNTGDFTWKTNGIAFALAPSITVDPKQHNAEEKIDVTITSVPRVRAGQEVIVIYGSSQVAPESITTDAGDKTQPSTIKAGIPLVKGKTPVRLRIAGVDSIPIRQTNGTLGFDKDQSIEVP